MSNEELVKLYKDGDETALGQLVEQNKNFIYKIARKFFISRDNALDREDLIQEGCIGLMKAADKYNVDKDILFLTYASYWIYQVIHRFMYPTHQKRKNKDIHINSLNERVPGLEDDIEQLEALADENVYPDIVENMANKEDWQQIEQLIIQNKELGEKALQVLKLRYGFTNGVRYSLEEIAEIVGIPTEEIGSLNASTFRYIRNSKWARVRRAEHTEYKKDRAYNIGRISDMLFDVLEKEIKHILNTSPVDIEQEKGAAYV
jgi:RNA polymerase primary sigma factor/RNA polymerase sporulation-specific sigma factor